MKNLIKHSKLVLLLFVLLLTATACSKEDNIEFITPPLNAKSVTECDIPITPNLLSSVCLDGADFALPGEVLTFAGTFFSKADDPSATEFFWSITSGSMEITAIENTVEGSIAKSIATIRFNADYAGNGIVTIIAKNENSEGEVGHIVN